jgi:hypothetical protein
MKFLNIAGHPIIVSVLFSLILISGEMFGGVYLMYLLMSLPTFSSHSILGFTGLVLANTKFKSSRKFEWIQLIGTLLMVLSLCIFFNHDKENYNINTFRQTLPLVSLILFIMSVLCQFLNVASKYKTFPPIDQKHP